MKIERHEDHFATAEPDVRRRLEQIQAETERRVPSAERCIAYGMPAFRSGRIFLYFAAFKKHIGLYPPVEGPPDLVADLAAFRGPKGNLSFPHDAPLPMALIGRTIDALARQYSR